MEEEVLELVYSRYLLKHGNHLFWYMSPVLIVCGNVGNFLSIVILCSAQFRKSPSTMMMIVLALMDTGNLNTGLLHLWLDFKYNIYIRTLTTTAGCKIHMFAVYFFGCMCGWSIVLMTFERVVSVLIPLRAREICSRRRMGIAMLAVTAFLFVNFLHLLVYTEMYSTVRYDEFTGEPIYYKSCRIKDGHYDRINKVLHWQDLLLSSAIPSGLIFIGNALIIYRLTKAQIKRRKTMNLDNQKQKGTSSITVMLVVVSVTFLITTLPVTIYLQRWDKWYDLYTLEGAVKAHFTYAVVHMMYYGNNTINFWLYFLSGRKFRQAFLSMFCPCRKQAKKTKTSEATASSTLSKSQGSSKF